MSTVSSYQLQYVFDNKLFVFFCMQLYTMCPEERCNFIVTLIYAMQVAQMQL